MGKIGKNIKKIRNVKGLSQQAFAELFQLTRGNISSYEEMRAEPKIEVIISIANYFGIPLNDFVQKDLSVNELLHYNTEIVLKTEKLKINYQLVKVPYVSAIQIDDYVKQYNNEEFILGLPDLIVPCSSKFNLIAIEIQDSETLPLGFNFKNGDVLIFESIEKENMHRIQNRLGMIVGESGIKTGVFKEENGGIFLFLNDWVNYPFEMESDDSWWVLRATYGMV